MSQKEKSPWLWVPTLFFTDAVPYVILTLLCVIYYKRTGISHTEITCMASLILLTWLIKPIVAESRILKRAARYFILLGQACITTGLLGLYFTAGSWYKTTSLLLFCLISIGYIFHATATQVLYATLNTVDRKFFQSLSNASYRLGTLAAAGILVMFVGGMETMSRKVTSSWSMVFLILAGCFLASLIYHAFALPPRKSTDLLPEESVAERLKNRGAGILATFRELTEQQGANAALLFLLFYPLPQALITIITPLFLLDPVSRGGAALSTQELGLCYGTIGLIALSAGSIIGIKTIKQDGLTTHLKTMALCMSFPCLGYLLVSLLSIEHFALVSLFVFIERFFYGFGFAAYVRFLRFFCAGKAHYYTWCSIYATLGFSLPGFMAGFLQETLGYPVFFVIVIATGIVPLAVSSKIMKTIHK